MNIKSSMHKPIARRQYQRPVGLEAGAADRYEPSLSDRFHKAGGNLMMALPGALIGGLGGAGVGFVNSAPFLGLATGLKVASVVGCLGAIGGGWLSQQIARID